MQTSECVSFCLAAVFALQLQATEQHHIVFTNKAVSGNNDIYVDGVRVVNDLYLGAYTAANGQFQLGGASNGDTLVTYYGARARNAVMYSGASFTRLSGPEAWGPP